MPDLECDDEDVWMDIDGMPNCQDRCKGRQCHQPTCTRQHTSTRQHSLRQSPVTLPLAVLVQEIAPRDQMLNLHRIAGKSRVGGRVKGH